MQEDGIRELIERIKIAPNRIEACWSSSRVCADVRHPLYSFVGAISNDSEIVTAVVMLILLLEPQDTDLDKPCQLPCRGCRLNHHGTVIDSG